VLCSWNQ